MPLYITLVGNIRYDYDTSKMLKIRCSKEKEELVTIQKRMEFVMDQKRGIYDDHKMLRKLKIMEFHKM